ncbi:mercury methylation ferredoxin HgcB [Desulfopila aestuarii]|uniref:mercury methylation ferredoxin HgcB n=1 Tax=Desulfopila aestuarii TaxID=231440 RepID=UPI0009367442|nr:mercury methylation ferredoxin HgcB [Desulfopila aestuarii]
MKDFRYLEETIQLRLDENLCTGCGNCVTVCPHRVFTMQDHKAKIDDRGGCMECGACSLNCPVAAIFVNPDEGCGCATLLIHSWLQRITGRKSSSACC